VNIELLQRLSTADPTNIPLRMDLSQLLLRAGRPVEALEAINANSLESELSASLLKAHVLFQLGDYTQALTWLTSLSERAPKEAVVWHDLAFAQLCMQQLDRAIQSIEHGIAIEDLMPFYIVWARVLHAKEDLDGAFAKVSTALEKEPLDSEALGVFSLLALDSNSLDEAEQKARQALTIDPRQHESLIVMGDLFVRNKRTDTALEHLKSALNIYPNSARLQTCFAQALMLKGDFATSIEFAGKSVALQPQHLGSWHILAWGQLLQGEIERARESFEMAYDVDRNFSETLAGLAVVCALEGKQTEAQQWTKRAKRISSSGATAVFADVLLKRLNGDTSADQKFASLLAQIPGDAELDSQTILAEVMRRLQPHVKAN
jgi:tetratricopeptide (TPR) repeat protein